MTRTILALFTLATLSGASYAHAQEVFCKVTGQKQGVITGDNTIKGLEDTLPVLSLSEGVSTPFDQATGQPTGKRQHKPLMIVKNLDKASPKLFLAAITNENLTAVECAFYRTEGHGPMQKYFQITLTNARIAETDI